MAAAGCRNFLFPGFQLQPKIYIYIFLNYQVNYRSLAIRRSTLLETLLAPEIRHERNVILQCLRHIVKKNFFGVEETSSHCSQNIVNS